MSLQLSNARAEALFTSDLSADTDPTPAQVDDAIRRTVRRRHISGCVEFMAREFGDHPEVAAARMRWARQVVAATYRRH